MTRFPIVCPWCCRELDGHLFLKQAQVQLVLSDVVAKRLNLRRILGRRSLLSSQVDMQKVNATLHLWLPGGSDPSVSVYAAAARPLLGAPPATRELDISARHENLLQS